MSEGRVAGILVDPMGSAEPIDANEYAQLKTCLEMLRADDHDADFRHALWFMFHVFKTEQLRPTTKDELVATQMWRLVSDEGGDEFDAILGPILGRDDRMTGIIRVSKSENETLQNTLTAIRIGGWFAEWLDRQVYHIATNDTPDDRHPSPLKIAGTLTAAIMEWQDEMGAAKKFAELRPDLLFPAPPAEPEAAVQDAAPVAGSTAPAKRRNARNSKRKAA